MRWYWQNLTRDDGKGLFPRNGRATFYPAIRGSERRVGLEWSLRLSGPRVGVEISAGNCQVTLSLGLGIVSLWLSFGVSLAFLESILPARETQFGRHLESREINAYWYHAALWWNLWTSPWETTAEDRRRHRVGCIHFDDLILGRTVYSSIELAAARAAMVEMPEGAYPVQMTRERSTWIRQRWPWAPFSRMEDWWRVSMADGIPTEEGDGIWELSVQGATIEDALLAVRERILDSRRRDSGSRNWRPRISRPRLRPERR